MLKPNMEFVAKNLKLHKHVNQSLWADYSSKNLCGQIAFNQEKKKKKTHTHTETHARTHIEGWRQLSAG